MAEDAVEQAIGELSSRLSKNSTLSQEDAHRHLRAVYYVMVRAVTVAMATGRDPSLDLSLALRDLEVSLNSRGGPK